MILGRYRNGNYGVIIKSDGTKIRYTEHDEFIPAFAENCDVKITDKCSQGCAFCYEGCTKEGKHADLDQPWIDTLHPYTELAINGNDLDHPQLNWFLNKLKDKKVITNITVNQNQFMEHIDLLKAWEKLGLIHGIGVSLNNSNDQEFINALSRFPNIVVHVINGLFSVIDAERLADKDIKLLILGYKILRRGEDYWDHNKVQVSKNQDYLYHNLMDLLPRYHLISFDNLALEQLGVKRWVSPQQWSEIYMGDDGKFTFYIDMVKQEFSQNSLSPSFARYPIMDSVDKMFNVITKGE